MKIAYIILAHKEPEQLIRLVHRLNPEKNSFFIHIDKRVDNAIYNEMKNGLDHFSNVYFLKRHRCFWGDFSLVKATIEGIDALDRKVPFDWLILLSGQDYPIKSNLQIDRFLENNQGISFIEYFPLPNFKDDWGDENGGLDRIEYWNFVLFNRRFRFTDKPLDCSREFLIPLPAWPLLFAKKRQFPKGLNPYGGGEWWCLPRECIEYIHNFIHQNRSFVRFFHHVHIPDEIFFQTIILNSPFKGSVVNDHLRYIEWSPKREDPAILGKDDFGEFICSSSLFARKFDVSRDREILDMIDRHILTVELSTN
jgi:Core-2/I-Branching enzyme